MKPVVLMLLCLFLNARCCDIMSQAQAAEKEKSLPMLVEITSMEGCPRCDEVEAEVIESGAKICKSIDTSTSAPAPYFPRCKYSDGKFDYGDRVVSGQCRFKKMVRVVKWTPKKEK